MMHPPVLPKLYWGAVSQEQRIAEICRRLCSVTDYLNYLSEVIVDLPEEMKAYTDAAIAEFQAELDAVLAQIQELVESMQDDVAQAKADAAQAAADAANALAVANGVDAKATQAMNDAANALSTAQGIDGKATQAMNDASQAETDAANALSIAQGIDGKATQAMNDAAAALAAVSQAAADAAAALAAAQAAQATANQAAADASSAAATANAVLQALGGFSIVDVITKTDAGNKFNWGPIADSSSPFTNFTAIILKNTSTGVGFLIGHLMFATAEAVPYNTADLVRPVVTLNNVSLSEQQIAPVTTDQPLSAANPNLFAEAPMMYETDMMQGLSRITWRTKLSATGTSTSLIAGTRIGGSFVLQVTSPVLP